MLRYSRQGKTVNDLMKSILSKLKDNELIIKFNTLCDEIITNKSDDDINECIYEYEYAQQNINFYEVGKIPRVKENLMPGVSDVNFTSKLNNIDSIEDFDNFNFYKFI